MKVSVLILSLSLILSACGSSSSSTSGRSQEDINQAEAAQLKAAPGVIDAESKLPPNDFTVLKAGLANTDESRSLGCKAPGSYESSNEMDPALKVGLRFQSEGFSQHIASEMKSTLVSKDESFVMEMTPDMVKVGMTVMTPDFSGSPFTDPRQVFISEPHTVSTFTRQEGGLPWKVSFDYEKNLTPAARQYVEQQKNGTYWSCNFESSTKIPQAPAVTDKILYSVSAGGKPVVAYKTVRTTKGMISCSKYPRADNLNGDFKMPEPINKIALGEGTSIDIDIVSNEVITRPSYNLTIRCGGENLYMARSYTLDSKKIISSSADKYTIPLR